MFLSDFFSRSESIGNNAGLAVLMTLIAEDSIIVFLLCIFCGSNEWLSSSPLRFIIIYKPTKLFKRMMDSVLRRKNISKGQKDIGISLKSSPC